MEPTNLVRHVDEAHQNRHESVQRPSGSGRSVIWAWLRSWWARAKITDERYGNIKVTKLEDDPLGFPRLAALMNSDVNLLMYRRFGDLRNRLLLHKQDELAYLENELHQLDLSDEKGDDYTKYRLKSRDFDNEQEDPKRDLLLEKINSKLKNYDDLLLRERELKFIEPPTKRNHKSLFNYIWNEAPLGKEEMQFILHREDLISLAHGQEDSPFDALVESTLQKFPSKKLQKLFTTPEKRIKTDNEHTHYYSPERLGILVKMIVTLISVALLMIPVVLLFEVSLRESYKLAIVLVFVLVFPVAIATFTKAKKHEVFAITAA